MAPTSFDDYVYEEDLGRNQQYELRINTQYEPSIRQPPVVVNQPFFNLVYVGNLPSSLTIIKNDHNIESEYEQNSERHPSVDDSTTISTDDIYFNTNHLYEIFNHLKISDLIDDVDIVQVYPSLCQCAILTISSMENICELYESLSPTPDSPKDNHRKSTVTLASNCQTVINKINNFDMCTLFNLKIENSKIDGSEGISNNTRSILSQVLYARLQYPNHVNPYAMVLSTPQGPYTMGNTMDYGGSNMYSNSPARHRQRHRYNNNYYRQNNRYPFNSADRVISPLKLTYRDVNRVCLVTNLNKTKVSWQDIKDLFRSCGEVIRVDLLDTGSIESRQAIAPDIIGLANEYCLNEEVTVATVLFEVPEGASRAVERLDGYEFNEKKLMVMLDPHTQRLRPPIRSEDGIMNHKESPKNRNAKMERAMSHQAVSPKKSLYDRCG